MKCELYQIGRQIDCEQMRSRINQLLMDSATHLLTINSPTLKSVAMSLYYDIYQIHKPKQVFGHYGQTAHTDMLPNCQDMHTLLDCFGPFKMATNGDGNTWGLEFKIGPSILLEHTLKCK